MAAPLCGNPGPTKVVGQLRRRPDVTALADHERDIEASTTLADRMLMRVVSLIVIGPKAA
jgi:hypothetical protein